MVPVAQKRKRLGEMLSRAWTVGDDRWQCTVLVDPSAGLPSRRHERRPPRVFRVQGPDEAPADARAIEVPARSRLTGA